MTDTQPHGNSPWPAELAIAPIAGARGSLRLPGSKSISNRALLLAALSRGRTRLGSLLQADDTAVMLTALARLGVGIAQEGDGVIVDGCDGRFPVADAELFLGNAGTAMRPLAAALAFAGGRYRLDGVARMRERPIGDLVDALQSIGARIAYLGTPGYPPLQIEPRTPADLRLTEAGAVRVKGNVSSQFLSGLLMAAPLLAPDQGLVIEVDGELISQPYVALTLAMMLQFGVRVLADGPRYHVPQAHYLAPGAYDIEGDASGASYFLALGAIAGGPITIGGVGSASLQGDLAFADLVRAMGADVVIDAHAVHVQRAGAKAGSRLKAFDIDATRIPDAAMTAAVMALFADGPCLLRGIGSWRVKETDRIAAMQAELRKVGAQVESGADWLRVTPPVRFVPARIDTYDDHRMAMCLALAAAGGVPIHVLDPGCVAKTFPGYFADLERLCRGSGAQS